MHTRRQSSDIMKCSIIPIWENILSVFSFDLRKSIAIILPSTEDSGRTSGEAGLTKTFQTCDGGLGDTLAGATLSGFDSEF